MEEWSISNAYNLVYVYVYSVCGLTVSWILIIIRVLLLIVLSTCSLLSITLVLNLLVSFLLRKVFLEIFLVIDCFEAAEPSLGGATAFTLHEVDPDEVGTLGLAYLFRSKHRQSGTLV